MRVPAKNVVGGVNKGWKLITNQLNHERVTLCSAGLLEQSFSETRTWAEATRLPDGARVIDQEWVQVNLARVYAGLDFLRLINWKVAWTGSQGRLDIADASTIKVFAPIHLIVRLLWNPRPRGYLSAARARPLRDGSRELRSLLPSLRGGPTRLPAT